MITRFDHAILAVESLDKVTNDFRDRLGFDVRQGGRHSGLGTENGILRFGLDYLEILGVIDRGEVEKAGVKRMSLLDYIDNNGGGWLAFCLATDNINQLASHFNDIGLRSLGPYGMERIRPDGTVLKWQLLVPEHSAWRKPWPFFIQWELPDEERTVIETPGDHVYGDCHVIGVHLVVRDLAAAKYLYIHQLGLEDRGSRSGWFPNTEVAVIGLGDFTIDLVTPTGPGPVMDELSRRGEGLVNVSLHTSDIQSIPEQVYESKYVMISEDRIMIDLLPSGDELRRAYLSIVN